MGMSSAFSDDADFTAMFKERGFEDLRSGAFGYVDVDEKGTEAAAATAVLMAPASAALPSEPPKPVVFRADHPFLFMIMDNGAGAIINRQVVRPEGE